MRTATARFQSRIPAPRAFVWAHYTRPGMFERLSPPWQHIKILSLEGDVLPGDRLVLRPRLGPFPLIWEAIHGQYAEGRLFTDRQGWGPFASWEHRHHFLDAGGDGCLVRDVVTFRLPLAQLSHRVGLTLAARELRRMFYYRHFLAFHDMVEHFSLRDHPRRAIAIRGGPEAARNQIAAYLDVAGHEVSRDAGAASGAVTVELGKASRGGLGAAISGAGEDARDVQVTTAMLLDRSVSARLRVAALLAREPDRALTWTTLSDVAAAIHRAVLGLYPADRVHVAHRVSATPRELAREFGPGMALMTRLVSPSDDPAAQENAIGGDVALERASRYRNAGHALRVMDGRP